MIFIDIVLVLFGFCLLAWSADRFVHASSDIARQFGISPLIIGVTIVALGTSAPEIFVSLSAAWQGNSGLAIGNVIGSNIANVGLVVGVTAIMAPMQVQSRILKREYPVLALIMLFAWVLVMDNYLGRLDGLLLLIALCLLILWLTWLAKKGDDEVLASEFEESLSDVMPMKLAYIWFVVGLVLLVVGAKTIVYGSVEIAQYFGVSDLIIGLTIVAIGTSLPEVATSIMATRKQEYDIAIGNVIGSNMFNLLAVLPFPGLISPTELMPGVLSRDIPVMITISVVLLLVSYGWRGRPGRITRGEGVLLIAIYIAYFAVLIRAAII